jgi:predicted kinase
VRSDLERKAMFGVGELERLPADSYTPESAGAVYARLLAKTRCALAAGHSVVADAVFLRAHERDGLERLARDLGVRFQGLWLTVPAEVAMARVAARRGDASDATAAVVARQIASMERGAWTTLDAGGSAEATAGKARAALA